MRWLLSSPEWDALEIPPRAWLTVDGSGRAALATEPVAGASVQLTWNGERLDLRTLGAPDGVWVNGHPVSEAAALQSGDRLTLGGLTVSIERLVGEPPFAGAGFAAGAEADDTVPDTGPRAVFPPAHGVRVGLSDPAAPALGEAPGAVEAPPPAPTSKDPVAASLPGSAMPASNARTVDDAPTVADPAFAPTRRPPEPGDVDTVSDPGVRPREGSERGAAAPAAPPHPRPAAPPHPRPARRPEATRVLLLAMLGVSLAGWGGVAFLGQPPPRAPQADADSEFDRLMRAGVTHTERREHGEAVRTLLQARRLAEPPGLADLISINALMAECRSDDIPRVVELATALAQPAGTPWAAWAKAERERWTAEQQRIERVRRGREYFANRQWREAVEAWSIVPRTSAVFPEVEASLRTARTHRAEELQREAEELIGQLAVVEARQRLEEAVAVAPPETQALLRVRLLAVSLSEAAAAELRAARQLLAQSQFDSALDLLERVPADSIFASEVTALRVQAKQARALQAAAEAYRLGRGETALRMLADGTSPEGLRLRALVAQVHAEYRTARQLAQDGRPLEAIAAWERLRELVADPGNQYFRWADAGRQVDPKVLARQHATEAARLWAAGEHLAAAARTGLALECDPEHAESLKMLQTIERDVALRFQLERQKWERSGDGPGLSAALAPHYRLLRAVAPQHRLLGKIAELFGSAGQEVPPPDAPFAR